MNKVVIALLVFGFGTLARSEVVLPKVIGSKMVLQRGVDVPIWGWADQGEEVTVSFGGQSKKAMPNAEGRWMVKLNPMTASSENRVMTIKGSNQIRIGDVLVGEVWLASGQSNMEWALRMIDAEEREYAAQQSENKLVRAFHVNQHVTSGAPLDDTVGWWKDCEEMLTEPQLSAGNIRGVSAVGFFFALKLQQELGVPVAFIDTNWGGRRIESFIPDEGYDALGLKYRKGVPLDHAAVTNQLKEMHAALGAAVAAAEQGVIGPVSLNSALFGRADNDIYNAMIAPVAPLAIKGAIWYQGESNRGQKDYFEKLQALSAGWSKVFNVKDIPLHLVQIAPYDYCYDRKAGKPGPLNSTLCDNIWAAEYRGAEEIAGMSVVPIHDTGVPVNNIHPPHKLPVGNRLAARALKEQYGKDVVAYGPNFAGARRDGAKVVVTFDNIDEGLSTKDAKAPSWFEISADGKKFVPADAEIKGNAVEVSSGKVAKPGLVRMGWYDTAIPNLQDKNGWPVLAFPAQPVK